MASMRPRSFAGRSFLPVLLGETDTLPGLIRCAPCVTGVTI